MKKIEATIVPCLRAPISDILASKGLGGVNSTDVKNIRGEHLGHRVDALSDPVDIRQKIEIVVTDEQVSLVIDTIKQVSKKNKCHQHHNRFGDSILISPVEEVIRIRTGETGNIAV